MFLHFDKFAKSHFIWIYGNWAPVIQILFVFIISDSEAILKYFVVVKYAKLLKLNKIQLPISACDKVGTFVNIYEVHQAKMSGEARYKVSKLRISLVFRSWTFVRYSGHE